MQVLFEKVRGPLRKDVRQRYLFSDAKAIRSVKFQKLRRWEEGRAGYDDIDQHEGP